ncbi:coiled-coil domain-containing protein 82 [Dendropsophus ebraccatus]|uniref:coiled-coil domain-containing protein 82 n=1 Tax=Dendropsophus ebraccatus TaxID=150705 RepID=UPI003831B995
METPSKTYNTRQKRKAAEPTLKSRVDWKRTKKDSISHVLDSEESSSEVEELEETSEESEDDGGYSDRFEERPEEPALGEDGDEGRIKKPGLKNKSAMIDSDSSSDSDGPGERVSVRRSSAIKEVDSEEEEEEETKAHNKKQKRLEKLNQLAEKQRSRRRTTSREAPEKSSPDEYAPLTPDTVDESEDSDNMSDFIVQDDDEEEDNGGGGDDPTSSYKDLFRKHHITTSESHDLSSHLQKVVKAFLINIIDENFLESLYKGVRKKRYAKDMLNSLNCLDNRIIGPRLEKLTTSCRWTKRYKERVESYPELRVRRIPAEQACCEACELFRYCAFLVTLSGKAYDMRTLESDDFLEDDKQILAVGKVCAGRTEVYHQLRHYKYCLYQRCIPFTEETGGDSVKKSVELALSKMEEKDFLKEEIAFLEGYLNEADYFQEEKTDSLYG